MLRRLRSSMRISSGRRIITLTNLTAHSPMRCCCSSHCAEAEDLFGERAAKRDLRRYHRAGPSATTRHLLRLLREQGVTGRTLLDIGGGVGVLQHELVKAGATWTLHVDASAAYLRASADEAMRQGHDAVSEYQHGNFVDIRDGVQLQDIVTLDRVVCCYPDMPRLVAASAAKARELYGLSFPRWRVSTRVVLALTNLLYRLKGSPFRLYVHREDRIAAEICRNGLGLVSQARTYSWNVAVYRRTTGEPDREPDVHPSRLLW